MARGTEKFYCPKCNRKTLVQENRWDRNHDYNKVWACKNAPPDKYRRVAAHGSYHHDQDIARAEEKAATDYIKKHPACGC